MNTKTSWALLLFVILAVVFVPLIPNDVPIYCNSGTEFSPAVCDDSAQYVSVYTKFFSR